MKNFSPAFPGSRRTSALVATILMAIWGEPAPLEAGTGDRLSHAPAASCIANNRFIVVSRSGLAPGNDIFIRPTAAQGNTKTCAPGEKPGDFRIAGVGEARHVLALDGNFLILDEGTGPSIRNLLAVDLEARREVWRSRYVPEPAPILSGHKIVFRKFLRLARKSDCRNVRRLVLQSLTPLYVVRGELSLPALAFRATGHPDCIAGQ
jgi:hypothetical protein